MPRVIHRTRVYRTQFRKLALHGPHWLATNLATTPLIKHGRTSTIGGWATGAGGGALTLTPVPDVSVQVVRVPEIFMGQYNPVS